ncbi:MAG: hypothetical protein N2201_01665 [candidate division WOR-3 bacterium]|nr:hypothetical protein [candidate division WOR-3 bacterium]
MITNSIGGFSYTTSRFLEPNPAYWPMSNKPAYSLRYLNFAIGIFNNSISFSSYNRNFNQDPDWDSIQKRTILNSVPNAGFKINGSGTALPIAFFTPWAGISFQYHELVSARLPKELFELVLLGNELNRAYDLSNIAVNELGYFDLALYLGYPLINKEREIELLKLPEIQSLNIGCRIHGLKGRGIIATDTAYGMLITTPDAFIAREKLLISTASGSNISYALDFGMTVQPLTNLMLGLAMLNLNNGFYWTQEPKQMLLKVDIDSLSLQRYLDTSDINVFVHSEDTSYPIAPFKTGMPAKILLQVGYQATDFLILSSNYYYYLSRSKLVDNIAHSIHLNLDFLVKRFFNPELTFETDFKNISIKTNFRFALKGFNFNLGVVQRNGLFTKSKGLGLDLNFAQNW